MSDGHKGSGLLPGDELQGRYKVVRKISEGGMGTIYLVEDNHLDNRRFALKAPRIQGLTPVEFQTALDAFTREVAVLTQLTHPNIAHIHDSFTEDSQPFFIMEYVDGDSLKKKIELNGQHHFDEQPVLDWSLQLVDVLKYLHTRPSPIIYRDLKPDNIMVDLHNHLKLIDFGTTRVFNPSKSGDTQALGTVGYAAPEQFGKMGVQSDPRTDIYALGATLHYLLTGRDPEDYPPFSFDSARTTNPSVSPELDTVVMKCLQKDVKDRYQSVELLQADLKNYGSGNLSNRPAGSTGLPVPPVPGAHGSQPLPPPLPRPSQPLPPPLGASSSQPLPAPTPVQKSQPLPPPIPSQPKPAAPIPTSAPTAKAVPTITADTRKKMLAKPLAVLIIHIILVLLPLFAFPIWGIVVWYIILAGMMIKNWGNNLWGYFWSFEAYKDLAYLRRVA